MTVAGMEATNNTNVRNQCREQEVGILGLCDDGKLGSDVGKRAFPIIQCKRDAVGVRKRSSRGKGLYSEDVRRNGRRNHVLSRARQAVLGQKRGARSKDDL